MKKIITWLLALGVLLSLGACQNPTSENSAPGLENSAAGSANSDPGAGRSAQTASYNGESRGEDGGNGTAQDGSLSLLYDLQRGEDKCVTDNGCYYLTHEMQRLSDGQYACHLMYMDFAARQEIYLCSNTGCIHNTMDCTSVFPMDEFPPYSTALFFWNDSLYLMSKDMDRDGTAVVNVFGDDSGIKTESKPTVLYRMEPDGTNREKVYTFDPNVTVEDFVVGDADGLYLITKKVSTKQGEGTAYQTSSKRELIQLDLSAQKETVLCSMDFHDDISWEVIGCTGRLLVLHGIDFGREVSEEEKHSDDSAIYDDSYDVFATLAVDSGIPSEIYRVYGAKARSYVTDKDNLYFSVLGDGSITSVDLRTGGQTVLCRIAQDSIWGIIGDQLYTRDSGDYTYYFIDVNTGEIRHSGLVNKSLGWSLDIIAEVGDQVLVIYDCDATANGDGSYSVNGYYYGLISKEDLCAGKDNFILISRSGRGM